VNTFLDQRVLERLRAEYLEMPGMKLRIEQVQRLCGIEQTMCNLVLDALVKASFLCLKSDGTYVRLTEGSSPRPRPVKAVLTAASGMTSRRASASMRREPDLATLSLNEPRREERRKVPACPQCDASNAECVEQPHRRAVCDGFGAEYANNLWSIARPTSSLPQH
jgi:hypothetical protein